MLNSLPTPLHHKTNHPQAPTLAPHITTIERTIVASMARLGGVEEPWVGAAKHPPCVCLREAPLNEACFAHKTTTCTPPPLHQSAPTHSTNTHTHLGVYSPHVYEGEVCHGWHKQRSFEISLGSNTHNTPPNTPTTQPNMETRCGNGPTPTHEVWSQGDHALVGLILQPPSPECGMLILQGILLVPGVGEVGLTCRFLGCDKGVWYYSHARVGAHTHGCWMPW
jgi:hypothetical protein